MRKFEKFAAQGEVNIQIVDELPPDLKPMQAENGFYVIGHSETGHHHVLDRDKADVFLGEKTSDGMQVLYAIVKSPDTALTHQRGTDTHAGIAFSEGDIVRFWPSIDYDPYAELIRRAAD